ncbi:hypothetical protein CO614_00895 [Lysobacteraceae bacterium NML120232]|nr:hypothetical protein CO608_10510 [Xanthomonadaceae bacterium NML08-0793]PJK13607.1 hypothetical protein CO614_00895 [Xanthomonadaceae bacterium NML120232]
MSKFDDITHRAAEMASQVGNKAADFASSIGSRTSHLRGGLKKQVPDVAMQWLETGAAIAAVKTGTKVATQFVRRHPVLVAATAVGVGVAWYASRRHARKKAEQAAIEGYARRLEVDEHAEDIGD